jgi:hypothetical protein
MEKPYPLCRLPGILVDIAELNRKKIVVTILVTIPIAFMAKAIYYNGAQRRVLLA